MWTIIIFIVLFLALINYIKYDARGEFEDYFLGSLFAIIIGLAIGLCIAYVLPAKTEIIKKQYNLECLQDGNSVNGSFFLGSGSIDGKMQYTFYYQEDGYFKLKQIDAEGAKIKYSDGIPHVERLTKQNIDGVFINLFALDGCDLEYIIYIPKGSIKNNFTLDAQ